MAFDSHRVVIVGGGFGGLFAARRLRRGPVRVALVDLSLTSDEGHQPERSKAKTPE